MNLEEEHRAVLVAAAQGDDSALEELVRVYHERVYRFGLRVCRDAYDADDAVQEAFTKLATRPEVMRDVGVLSWLMTVTRNACIRMLRPFTRQRRALGEPLDDVDTAPTSELDAQQVLERWELVRAVHACIAALERPYREVIVLRDLEGLSGAATCAALGLELATMKTRLNRARTQLRELLRKRGKEVL